MDHIEATKSQAVEKYFLGELKGEQREAFEEHFFDCAECAADVKTTAVLVDNVREVLRSVPADARKVPGREPRTSGFLNWWKPAYSFAAVALLLATVGYQNFVTIPQIRQGTTTEAQALPSYSFVTAGSRGAAGLEITVPAHTPFGIYVDIPGDPSFASYSADVVNQSGTTRFSVPISAEQTRDTVQLLIPGSKLEAGQYDLVIKGYKAGSTAGQEIIRHPFNLRTK
jgi:hypothetical protein